jgi:peptidoglycan hydrolase CwlO-like protein
MTMEEFQTLKNELQQLNVEMKRFKEELLTTRIEELKQIVHAPARRLYPRMPEISMSVDQDVD